MAWDEWGPAILSSIAATGIAVGMTRYLLEAGIKHGFERQIEKLKSELRESESEIQSIRSTLLGGFAQRNAELNKRRLQAAETLWKATTFQRRYTLPMSFAQLANMDAIHEMIESGGSDARGLREMADVLWKASNLDGLAKEELSNVAAERLFVPPRAWLAYHVISSLSSRATLVLGSIRAGASHKKFIKDTRDVNQLVKNVLPEMTNYLDQYPDEGAYFLIQQLEEVVFLELLRSVSGKDYDLDDAQRVAELVRRAEPARLNETPIELPESLRSNAPPPPAMIP